MKQHLPSFLPALALLTLGGCVASSNLATTESDGMYYSAAADRVTTVALPVAPQAPTGNPGDVANPDYSGSTARSGGDEYYDDDYYATSRQRRFRSPYRGSSLGYYDFSYSDPYFYGAPIGYSPYSPYSFYDPFYSPYYGYGGLTINIGFGYGFGRPYYRPYGYGYGYGADPYYAYGGYYNGYRNGYQHGYNNGYYNNGYYGNVNTPGRSNAIYGPRRSRVSDGAGLGNVTGTSASGSGRRVIQEAGFTTRENDRNSEASVQPGGRRVREVSTGTAVTTGLSSVAQPGGRVRDERVRQETGTALQPESSTRRWRVLDNASSGNAAGSVSQPQPAMSQPDGRGRRVYSSDGANSPASGYEQPQRQRTIENTPTRTRSYEQPTRSYEQPVRSSSPAPTRSYEQPVRSSSPAPTRSYEQPVRSSSPAPTRSYEQPTRSYEQPTRSYSEPSRSYSSPSRSSSNSGGSSGGGRGRVR